MEAILKQEIYDLGYDIVKVEDGRVTYEGDMETICRANIHLRTTERVLLKVGGFHAETFDELFEAVKALPWEEYLPVDAKFWVTKASSVKSKLFSPSDIQSIVKKAIVERLKDYYDVKWFEETGASYPIRVFLNKDEVTIGIDTTGESLHKRGYRTLSSKAPITETLAAAMILLTPWKKDRILVDPFCGSGTIPIEAAMIAANIAPGMNRTFTSQTWTNLISQEMWEDCFEEAREMVDDTVETTIQGYDLDGDIIKAARENAKRAGVDHLIHFQQRPVKDLNHPKKYGFIITNPPYGERLEEKQALPALYREIGEAFSRLDCWSEYLITSYEEAERYIGKKADKKRKIYNGMLKTNIYQYIGPRPPRREKR
jgi:putative N6-adenine-specific DNA methylase